LTVVAAAMVMVVVVAMVLARVGSDASSRRGWTKLVSARRTLLAQRKTATRATETGV
jgi:hypothetical protein